MDANSPGQKRIETDSKQKGTLIDFKNINVPVDTEDVFLIDNKIYDTETIELFLNLPQANEMECPVTVERIQDYQTQDEELTTRRLQR